MLDFLVASSKSMTLESVCEQIKTVITPDARVYIAKDIDTAFKLYQERQYMAVVLIDDFPTDKKTAADFLGYARAQQPQRDRSRIYVTNNRNIEPLVTMTYGARCIGFDSTKVAERILPFLQG